MELSNPLISEYTWANKPSVAPLGQIICVTDVGENGSLWRGDGTKWKRIHQIRFSDLSAPVALTGTTSETTLLTVNIPASLIGASGKVKMYPLYSMTNNANSKLLRVKLGGSMAFYAAVSNSAHSSALVIIRNIGSESVQKSSTSVVSGLGNIGTALNTLAIDTSAATTITVTGQLANSADTMTLEGFFMEIV
jgi:hypothetical protein